MSLIPLDPEDLMRDGEPTDDDIYNPPSIWVPDSRDENDSTL